MRIKTAAGASDRLGGNAIAFEKWHDCGDTVPERCRNATLSSRL
jgi:hypothetical protein